MELQISDWRFQVDVDATFSHTSKNAQDHCECGYCRNYYCCVELAHPVLRPFLSQFGVVLEGPSELMPFESTYLLVCYRVYGSVVNWGTSPLFAGEIPVTVQMDNNGTFLLWVGEMRIPWCIDEPVDEVISPANTAEFMDRMREMWYFRHAEDYYFS